MNQNFFNNFIIALVIAFMVQIILVALCAIIYRLTFKIRLGLKDPKILVSIFRYKFDVDPRLPNIALPYGDALVTEKVNKRFLSRKTKIEEKIAYMEKGTFPDYCTNSDLIFIGGPKHNYATIKFLSKLEEQKKIPVQFSRVLGKYRDEDCKVLINKTNYGKSKEYRLIEKEGKIYDLGTIIFTINPFNSDKKILILAGMGTFATLMAGQFISRPKLLLKLYYYKLRYQKGFQLIFYAERHNYFKGKITSTEVFSVQ